MSQLQRRRLEELQVRVAQLRLQVAKPPDSLPGKVARSAALLDADARVARLRHDLAEAQRAWVQLERKVARGMLLPQLPVAIVAAALLTLEECFNQRTFTVSALCVVTLVAGAWVLGGLVATALRDAGIGKK